MEETGSGVFQLLLFMTSCAQSLSSVPLFVTLSTVACQAPLSIGFSYEEYWSGLPCPPPGDLPNPGIKPKSPALAGEFFTTEPPMTSYDSEKQLSNAH